jgi:hypothetical protein
LQQNALHAIKDTTGFEEIRNYFRREYDQAVNALSGMDAKNISKVAFYQGQMHTARAFLDFLDRMTE